MSVMRIRNSAQWFAAGGSLALALGLSGCAPAETEGDVEVHAQGVWQVSEFVGPSPFHGLHGLAVEPDGTVLAGSVVGQAIYAVDPASGEVTTRIPPPHGMADDIAFGPDGVMAWTGYLTGKTFVQEPGGQPRMVSEGLPGSNSLAFTPDGRLYMTQVFLGDALHEVDWKGDGGARLIREGLGGLNGFEVGPDGMIYGPLWFLGEIARVDPATGEATTVAGGFEIPAAANFGPDGMLYAIDTKTGELVRIDPDTGEKTLVATMAPAIDNLAMAPNGMIYVSNMAEATIYEVDPATGSVRTVVSGPMATPTDLALRDGAAGEMLHVADTFAYRVIDTATGAITDPLRMQRDETEYQLGIGAGADRVLITSWAAGTVQVVDAESGASLAIHHGLVAPTDALQLADGRMIALEAASGNIVLIDADEESTPETPPEVLVSGLNLPVAMVEADDGALYVTETSGTLAKVDLASGAIERVADGLAGPEGIDVGADGRIYLAEVGARRVVAYDPASGEMETLAEGLEIGLPSAEGSLPAYTTTGVAASRRDGAVYVASDLTNAIYRLTPPVSSH